ncbi:MAG: hypothetical protein R2708_15255 [Vicinamibacterales bacterium]
MPWWMWLAGGFVLLVLELVTPSGFFIMFFGAGAILTGVLTSAGLVTGVVGQWFTFTAMSVGALLLFRGKLQARGAAHRLAHRLAHRRDRHAHGRHRARGRRASPCAGRRGKRGMKATRRWPLTSAAA